MHRITGVIFALVVAFGVAGCAQSLSGVNVAIENASESAQLSKICRLRPIAVAGFDLLRSQVTISDSITAKVYQTSAALHTICIDRPSNVAEALITATKLYSELLSSQKTVSMAVAAKLGD